MALERISKAGVNLLTIGVIGLCFDGFWEFVIRRNQAVSASDVQSAQMCLGVSGLLTIIGGIIVFVNYLANRGYATTVIRSLIFPIAGIILVICGIANLFLTGGLGLYPGSDSAREPDTTESPFKTYLTDKNWVQYDLPKGYGFNAFTQDGREILYMGSCIRGKQISGPTFIFYDHNVYEINPNGTRGKRVSVYVGDCVLVRAKDGERVGVNVSFYPLTK